MGKHKKFLKSEKAKVKLKGNKLKAAQNVTRTDFKVKKIVINEQLRNVKNFETGERKKHNISDCLVRLKNSASPEAISNLKEIILHQPADFQKNLESILKAVANLSLSLEKNDRKECFKILDIICAQTEESNLRPFFPMLIKYLKCAMTHIKSAVQEDSLIMLDILLKNAPQLVADEKDNILSPYLDMVSKMRSESNPERTLSLQLGNKITSMKWRKSVLERLVTFLKCINSERLENEGESCQRNEIVLDKNAEYIGNPYHMFANKMGCTLTTLSTLEDSTEIVTLNGAESNQSTIKYLNMIMPLMFETWTELKPTEKEYSADLSILTFENSIMLKLITDIIMELFYMLEKSTDVKQHFLKKYQDKFEKQLLVNFPYSQNDASKKTPESGGEKCIYQNISIAILYLFFTMHNQQRFYKYNQKVLKFIEQSIDSWKIKDSEFNFGMKKIIRTLFTKNSRRIFANELKPIFNALIKKCNVDQSTYDPKFALVCEIIESNDDIKKDALYGSLISQMVQVLAQKKSIPLHLIRTIVVLAKRGNPLLTENLTINALEIAKNLQSSFFEVTGALNDGERWKKETYNLMYWINDKSVLESLSNQLTENSYMRELVLNKMGSC